MTDIYLMHGNDDFYPYQVVRNWKDLDRIDRQIYFLSNKKNSCADIAFLLKKSRKFVRNRLCVLFIQGYIILNVPIRFNLIERSLYDLREYKQLCTLQFYEQLKEHFSLSNDRNSNLNSEQLESEFFSLIHFIVRVVEMNQPDVIQTLISIIRVYHLQTFLEQTYDIAIRSILYAFSYCLQDEWDSELEDSWERVFAILKCCLLDLSQQNL